MFTYSVIGCNFCHLALPYLDITHLVHQSRSSKFAKLKYFTFSIFFWQSSILSVFAVFSRQLQRPRPKGRLPPFTIDSGDEAPKHEKPLGEFSDGQENQAFADSDDDDPSFPTLRRQRTTENIYMPHPGITTDQSYHGHARTSDNTRISLQAEVHGNTSRREQHGAYNRATSGVDHQKAAYRMRQGQSDLAGMGALSHHSHQNLDKIQKLSLPPPPGSPSADERWEYPREKIQFREKLGDGSFGEVWKAVAPGVAGRKGATVVAIKMLKGTLFLYFFLSFFLSIFLLSFFLFLFLLASFFLSYFLFLSFSSFLPFFFLLFFFTFFFLLFFFLFSFFLPSFSSSSFLSFFFSLFLLHLFLSKMLLPYISSTPRTTCSTLRNETLSYRF